MGSLTSEIKYALNEERRKAIDKERLNQKKLISKQIADLDVNGKDVYLFNQINWFIRNRESIIRIFDSLKMIGGNSPLMKTLPKKQ